MVMVGQFKKLFVG